MAVSRKVNMLTLNSDTNITIRSGFATKDPQYNGKVNNNRIKIDASEEWVDCGDEDKILFIRNCKHGSITLVDDVAKIFRHVPRLAEIRTGFSYRYSLPSSQHKTINPDGSVTFSF